MVRSPKKSLTVVIPSDYLGQDHLRGEHASSISLSYIAHPPEVRGSARSSSGPLPLLSC